MRQWVLTAPFEVRRVHPLSPEALTAQAKMFVDEIAQRIECGETGAVTFVQLRAPDGSL